jgi:hypothetical protein
VNSGALEKGLRAALTPEVKIGAIARLIPHDWKSASGLPRLNVMVRYAMRGSEISDQGRPPAGAMPGGSGELDTALYGGEAEAEEPDDIEGVGEREGELERLADGLGSALAFTARRYRDSV